MFALVLLLLLQDAGPPADTAAAARPEQPLAVGVAEQPPFAIKGENGTWQGIGVQLWREVADAMNLTYDLRELPSDSLASRLAGGALDVALTAPATRVDEQRIDFLHPYYTATLGVAGTNQRSLWSIVKGVFTMRFLRIALWLSALLFIVGVAIWLIERHQNDDHFGGERSALEGVGAGFWWSGVTMTTIGYGDKAPKTFWGRTLALLWMLVAMGITASLTASIVSAVGMGSSNSLNMPGDLRGKKVGSVPNTESAEYLEDEGVAFQEFGTPLDGLRALQQDEIDTFVGSAPTLRYLMSEHAALETNVQTTSRYPQRYALALPAGSPLREPMNQAVLRTINDPTWRGMIERHLPEQQQGPGS